MNRSIRFGVNVGGLLRNVAIFVLKVDLKTGQSLVDAVEVLKAALSLAGYPDIAKKLVCEWR